MRTAFIVHGDDRQTPDRESQIEALEWHVAGTSAPDPDRVAEAVAMTNPDALLVWLPVDPLPALRSVLAAKQHEDEEGTPVIFLDGTDGAVQAARGVMPAAHFVDSYHLEDVLKRVDRGIKEQERA